MGSRLYLVKPLASLLALSWLILACDSGATVEEKTNITPHLGLSTQALKNYTVEKGAARDGSAAAKAIAVKGVQLTEGGASLVGMFDGPSETGFTYEVVGPGASISAGKIIPTGGTTSATIKVSHGGKVLYVELFFGKEWTLTELEKLSIDGNPVVSAKKGTGEIDYVLRVSNFMIAANSSYNPADVTGDYDVPATFVADGSGDDAISAHPSVTLFNSTFANRDASLVWINSGSFALSLARPDYRVVTVKVEVSSEVFTANHSQVRALSIAGVNLSQVVIDSSDAFGTTRGSAELRRVAGWRVPGASDQGDAGELALSVGGLLPGWEIMFANDSDNGLGANVTLADATNGGVTITTANMSSKQLTLAHSGSAGKSLLGQSLSLTLRREGQTEGPELVLVLTFRGAEWNVSDLTGLMLAGQRVVSATIVDGVAEARIMPLALDAGAPRELPSIGGVLGVAAKVDSFSLTGLDNALDSSWFGNAAGVSTGMLIAANRDAADFAGKQFKLTLTKAGAEDLEVTFTFTATGLFAKADIDAMSLGGLSVSGYHAGNRAAYLALPTKRLSADLNLANVAGAAGYFFEPGSFNTAGVAAGSVLANLSSNGSVGTARNRSEFSGKAFKATLRADGKADTEITFTFRKVVLAANLDGATFSAGNAANAFVVGNYNPDTRTATLSIPDVFPANLTTYTAALAAQVAVALKTDSFVAGGGDNPIGTTVLSSADGTLTDPTVATIGGKTFRATLTTAAAGYEPEVEVTFTIAKREFLGLNELNGLSLGGAEIFSYNSGIARVYIPREANANLGEVVGETTPAGFTISDFKAGGNDPVPGISESGLLNGVVNRTDLKGKTFIATLNAGGYQETTVTFIFSNDQPFLVEEIESLTLGGLALSNVDTGARTGTIATPTTNTVANINFATVAGGGIYFAAEADRPTAAAAQADTVANRVDREVDPNTIALAGNVLSKTVTIGGVAANFVDADFTDKQIKITFTKAGYANFVVTFTFG